jgi:biopolymer transport protein ExbD
MAVKKLNVEELEKQCLEAKRTFETLHEQLIKVRKEEEEAKRAKLKAEKDVRYKEIIDAYENFEELRDKYVDDYGSFTFKTGNGVGSVWRWVFDEE